MTRITDEASARRVLMNDLDLYARSVLRIRTKAGGPIQPLRFNAAQRFVHARLQDQLHRTGMVRALVLKGRQQGISTYVSARFLHKATHGFGRRVFILSHEGKASSNLFRMVERYYENVPAALKPPLKAFNQSELIFDGLDSGYRVATAGAKGTGRSETIQLLHGSEVAFWPEATEHMTGALQAVPDEPGTEIILESTANGPSGEFYNMWRGAQRGENGFQAIFVPWFWQDEYRKTPEEGFVLDDDEREYASIYGLGLEQMAWRRVRISRLNENFQQEYPATAEEAFYVARDDALFDPSAVFEAMHQKARLAPTGPKVGGVDPAGYGADRVGYALRRGRVVSRVWSKKGQMTHEVVNEAIRMIQQYQLDYIFIDVGYGHGVIDGLIERGFGDKVIKVQFGGRPENAEAYRNKRAEIYGRLKEWLEDGPVSLPESPELADDLATITYKRDAHNRLQLTSKEEMRRKGVASPDLADALAMTFAEPVQVGQSTNSRARKVQQGAWAAA